MRSKLDYLLEREVSMVPEDTIARKILQSKMKSLNEHLAALVQKKIRIDLEIKRTKKKLTKLKNQSSTNVKMKVELEGFNYDLLDRDQVLILQEQCGPEVFQDLLDLDIEIDRAEDLLRTYEDLPLYDDNTN